MMRVDQKMRIVKQCACAVENHIDYYPKRIVLSRTTTVTVNSFVLGLSLLLATSASAQTSALPDVHVKLRLEADTTTELVNNLKKTVIDGRFRFVVLMDNVEDRLKNLIAFVNSNSSFDVLGVALDFYQHDDIDILIPTLHGAEIKKTVTSSTSSTRRTWNEESFFADASSRISEEQLKALRSLYDWAKEYADEISYGPGAVGSINPKVWAVCSRSIFTARSDGTLRLNFSWLNEPESAKVWPR